MSTARRLLSLTVILMVVLSGSIAFASHTATSKEIVSGFEIDGDYDFDGYSVTHNNITVNSQWDWDNIGDNPDASAITSIFDPPLASGPEFIFSNGSKEQQPGKWAFANQKPPSKDDLTRAYLATEFSATKSTIWLAFERVDASGAGDAHANFELNHSTAMRIINGHSVPVRSAGDLLIVYDYSGGTGPVGIEVHIWNGNADIGTWDPITPEPTAAAGDINSAAITRPAAAPFGGGTVGARRFGEAGVDLTQIFAGDPRGSLCNDGGFHQFSVKSRSSGQSFNSALKDYVGPANIITCPEPASDLDKGVKIVGADPTTPEYQQSISAEPGDTLEYQVLYTNEGNAAASDITVTDQIETDFQNFDSCSNSCTEDGGLITWHIDGPVAPGDSVPLTFRVTLDSSFPTGTQTINNQADGTAAGEDGFSSDITTVTVTAAPAIGQHKQVRVLPDGAFADSTTADPGDSLEYKITWSNTGDADAVGYSVT
ncbi:MAG: DUF11 domain-containing protein, partial [Actinobacteria bacterium]|nr:DUF11 domain-containing protein [Actinomycetota bacterium]